MGSDTVSRSWEKRNEEKLEKRRYGRIAVGAKLEKSSGDSSGHRFKVRVGFEYYNRVYDDFYVGLGLYDFAVNCVFSAENYESVIVGLHR